MTTPQKAKYWATQGHPDCIYHENITRIWWIRRNLAMVVKERWYKIQLMGFVLCSKKGRLLSSWFANLFCMSWLLLKKATRLYCCSSFPPWPHTVMLNVMWLVNKMKNKWFKVKGYYIDMYIAKSSKYLIQSLIHRNWSIVL